MDGMSEQGFRKAVHVSRHLEPTEHTKAMSAHTTVRAQCTPMLVWQHTSLLYVHVLLIH